MIRLGEQQELEIVKQVDFGVYLAESEETAQERILLPRKQVPEGSHIGDKLEVFVYLDSKDRMISTRQTPKLVMDQAAPLAVVSVQQIGAFLNWGLEKDLFLPYKEQNGRVQEGDEVLVRLYIDKSGRLCASMRGLYEMLSQDSPYQTGDQVSARVYEFSDNFGAFLAVDDKYSARIPRHEDYSSLRIGQIIQARVIGVRPDGKLELSVREKAHVQMEDDAQRILALLDEYKGTLPFNDKASPELILKMAKMSKAAFKRAVGRLYKERKIEITADSIRKL